MSIKANYPAIRPSLNLDFANTKTLDPRITFTRATTATYYDGKTVAKAEENLTRYSQEFDNAVWTKNYSTVIANATTAPDGTTTADALIEDTTNAYHQVAENSDFKVISGEDYTMSMYVKPNGRDYAYLYVGIGGTAYSAKFNISTGTYDGYYTGGSAATVYSIVSAGNGWYRVSMTFTAPSSGTINTSWAMYNAAGNFSSTYVGDGSSGIYIWGAQLEQRSSVTAYTPTTTQPITNYIPVLQSAASGEARFDHDPVTGESLGLLIEEQRTNLLKYSEEFDGSGWNKYNSSVIGNTIVSPDGTLTGDLMVKPSGLNNSYFGQNLSLASGVYYTCSVYVKYAGFAWAGITISSNVETTAWFNIVNGTVGTVRGQNASASIVNVGNGWWRIVYTWQQDATQAENILIRCSSADDSTSSAGNGYSGAYFWGAQLEVGTFPTSYIPTVASQVTRNADTASMTGTNFSSWYRADEGTFYSESSSRANNQDAVFTASDGSNNNRIASYNGGGSSLNLYIAVAPDSVAQVNIGTYTYVENQFVKLAGAYKVNDFATSGNGVTPATDTSGKLPVVDRFYISANGNGITENNYIKKLAYYPARLTNAQLQGLTS